MAVNKVSIIMGIYNCENTLRESIESILMQTFEDWEFIICDDASRDKSLEIANEYKRKFPEKFIVLKNVTNVGLNKTLNKCLKIAQGEYIARQDGDDRSVASRLQKEVTFLDEHPEYDFVSSNMSFFDERGIWGEWKNAEKPQRRDLLEKSPCFCHAPCMIRKKAFVSVEGYSEENRYLRCEDVNLWYKLYANGCKGYNIQEALYLMRDNKEAYRRRTVQNRINIILTEWDGMKKLECSLWEYRFFVKKAIKNMVAIILPERLYKYFHNKRLNS